MASRTSCTLPQSAALLVGRMMTLVTRRSTAALRSASTIERTVGGASRNWPSTPPGSTSWRSPPTSRSSVELDEICGPRPPTARPRKSSPTAETATATRMRTITIDDTASDSHRGLLGSSIAAFAKATASQGWIREGGRPARLRRRHRRLPIDDVVHRRHRADVLHAVQVVRRVEDDRPGTDALPLPRATASRASPPAG